MVQAHQTLSNIYSDRKIFEWIQKDFHDQDLNYLTLVSRVYDMKMEISEVDPDWHISWLDQQ